MRCPLCSLFPIHHLSLSLTLRQPRGQLAGRSFGMQDVSFVSRSCAKPRCWRLFPTCVRRVKAATSNQLKGVWWICAQWCNFASVTGSTFLRRLGKAVRCGVPGAFVKGHHVRMNRPSAQPPVSSESCNRQSTVCLLRRRDEINSIQIEPSQVKKELSCSLRCDSSRGHEIMYLSLWLLLL